jgi:hypothetical protein
MEWTKDEQAELQEHARKLGADIEVRLAFHEGSRDIGVSLGRDGEASRGLIGFIVGPKDMQDARDKIEAEIKTLLGNLTQGDPKPVLVPHKPR